MALPASDDFNRANNTTLGANWSLNKGLFGINTNAAYSRSAGADTLARWNADTFADDQYSQVTISAMPINNIAVGVAVRLSTSGAQTGYFAYAYENVAPNLDVELAKYVAGTYTTIATTSGWAVGDVLRLEVQGTTLRVYRNGSLVDTQTDSSIASGSAGVSGFGSSTSCRMDNWSGGNLGGTVYNLVVSGALSPTGAVVKTTLVVKAGTLTSSGAPVKTITVVKAGTLTSAGSLVKTALAVKAGSISPTGAIVKTIALVKAGALSPTGVVSKTITLIKSGVLSFTGDASLARTIIKLLSGAMSWSGDAVKTTVKIASGAISPSGSIVKTESKTFTGSISPSGALIKTVGISKQGSLSFAGSLVKTISLIRSGILSFIGGISKIANKVYGGSFGPSGSINISTAFPLDVDGTIAPTGSLTRNSSKILQGTATFQGNLTRNNSKVLTGIVTFSGGLSRRINKLFSGVLSFIGNLVAQLTPSQRGDPFTAVIVDISPRLLLETSAPYVKVVAAAAPRCDILDLTPSIDFVNRQPFATVVQVSQI